MNNIENQPPIHKNPKAITEMSPVWEEYGSGDYVMPVENYIDNTGKLKRLRELLWDPTFEAFPSLEPRSLVVDVGIGPGHMALGILNDSDNFPEAHVVGVDLSLAMLEQAQANVATHANGAEDRVELYQANAIDGLPVEDESASLVTMSFFSQYNPREGQIDIFTHAYNALKSGGALVLNTMTVPFGPVAAEEIAIAAAEGDEAGAAHIVSVMGIGKKLAEAGGDGKTYNPSREDLIDMLAEAGFDNVKITYSLPLSEELAGKLGNNEALIVARATK